MANTQFVVNSKRYDPYKNFKFHVRFDGRLVAGVSKVSGLKQSTEPVSFREGGDPQSPRLTPGTWKYDPITLERGVTHDTDFENWAKLVWDPQAANTFMSLENFRKDLTIELLNEQGTVVLVYHVFRCWVSTYQPITGLDANTNTVAIESIIVQNEGWSRDTSYTEPKQS